MHGGLHALARGPYYMKVVIIGGGAAGASCAARLARLKQDAQITVLEATGEISIGTCGLPYYCSGIIADRENLMVFDPVTFKQWLNVDVKLNSPVTSINRQNKTVILKSGEIIAYDKLVLATGAVPVRPDLQGIDKAKIFAVKTLADADKIKGFIAQSNPKKAVVIGGGFVGVEMAESLISLGLNTTLVEQGTQILANSDYEMAAFMQNEMRRHGCTLIFNNGVKNFQDSFIELHSGDRLQYDMAILAIGMRPNTHLALQCGLDLGLRHAVQVNSRMQSSDPDIYAAGDSVETCDLVTGQPAVIHLAGPANRQGRIIADNIAGLNSEYKKSLGTSIIKVFGKTLASVGNNEKQLQFLKLPYKKHIVWANSHAGYYPGAKPMAIKILFSQTGKIYGAQIVGEDGADKRIDVIATVMRLNGTVSDLTNLELAYAPPYSGAKDAVNVLGMAVENVLNGYVTPAFFEDLQGSYLVDVRPPEAYQKGALEGAVNIPLAQLRQRAGEIPKDKKVIMCCAKGYSSYTATRILNQLGFNNIYSFAGGKPFYDEIVKDKACAETVFK